MTHTDVTAAVTAQATFGRDGAMFESLLGFVAQLSVVLWSLVVLTAVIRFIGIRIYRRSAARAARMQTVTPSAADAPTIATSVDAPVSTPLGAPRTRLSEPRLTAPPLTGPRPVAHLPAAHVRAARLPAAQMPAHAVYSRDA